MDTQSQVIIALSIVLILGQLYSVCWIQYWKGRYKLIRATCEHLSTEHAEYLRNRHDKDYILASAERAGLKVVEDTIIYQKFPPIIHLTDPTTDENIGSYQFMPNGVPKK